MTTATIALIVLVIAIILLMTEAVPFAWTGLMIPMVLAVTGVIDIKTAYQRFSHPTVFLIMGIFVISAAIFEVGIADLFGRRISKLIHRFGSGERIMILIVMLAGAGMSTVLPNTGTTAILIPIVIAAAASTGISRSKLLMALAFSTTMGGMITLIGTPPNLFAKAALESADLGTFEFLDFAWVGIPMTVIGIIYMLTIGYKLLPDNYHEERENTEELIEDTEPVVYDKKKQVITAIVFVTFVLGIIFEKKIGIPAYFFGFAGGLVLVLSGVLTEKKVFSSINWGTTTYMVGMLTLADGLLKSGASQMIANAAVGIIGNTTGVYVLTAGFFLISTIMTQFMSNTATSGLLYPIGISIATGLGADPKAVVMAITVGCSCAFATPIGTPANVLIMIPGQYKFKDFLKVGIPMVAIGFVISMIVLPLAWPFF